MKPTSQDNAPPPARPQRTLWVVLGIAVALFLATLPWQRQQWEHTRQLEAETRVQELRLQEIAAQKQQAETAQSRLQNAPTTDLTTRFDAGRAMLSHGDTTGATKIFQEIEVSVLADVNLTNDANLAITLAGLFQEASWIDHALINAERAFRLAPSSPEAVMRLAIIEAQLGWQKECREHIALARKLAPDAAEPHLCLALLNDQVEARQESEKELLIADKLRPGDASILLLLYQNRLEHRRYDAAIETVEQSLQKYPSNPSLLFARAEVLIERALSRPGQADLPALQAGLAAAQKYQQLNPGDANVRFLTGKALLGLGKEPEAIHEWEELYKVQPNQAKLAMNLGRLLVRRGERERGKQLIAFADTRRTEDDEFNRLTIAAGADRNNPEKHRQMAIWCQAHYRLSRAILEWEQVLRLRPEDKEATSGREKCVALREHHDV